MAPRVYYGDLEGEWRDFFYELVHVSPQYADWSREERQEFARDFQNIAEYGHGEWDTGGSRHNNAESTSLGQLFAELGHDAGDHYLWGQWRDLYGA